MAKDAEYYRNYRKSKKGIDDGRHQGGVREGIALVAKYFREVVAGRAITGYQAAAEIDKAFIGGDSGELEQRRRMLDGLRGA